MKKLLLSVFAASAVLGAQAADLSLLWDNTVSGAFDAGNSVFNAPDAVDANGNMIATGAFEHDVTIAGSTLAAVGTSAYVAKYDLSGNAVWAVALPGSASISAVATDAAGNIYVAGTYADEVELGSADGKTATINGMEIWGAPTVEKNASFLAKYTPEGNLAAQTTFIPADLPELAGNESYFSLDGDIYFHINHLAVAGDKVYASAIYTGVTESGNAKFEGSYNDPWGGVIFLNLPGAAVFSLSSDLSGAENVATAGYTSSLAADGESSQEYKVGGVTFAVNDAQTVYAVFSGNGPLKISGTSGSQTLTAADSEYNYIFASVKDGALDKVTTDTCPAAGFKVSYVPVYADVKDNELFVVGYESFAVNAGEENERSAWQYFAYHIDTDVLEGTKYAQELVDGNISYYTVTSGARPGYIVFNVLGYYNASGDGFANGDFARVSKTVEFDFGSFKTLSYTDKCGIAADGQYVAFSGVESTGNIFSLYKNEEAGVGSVTVSDENSPVEYFNLQGMRVENPAAGLYIRRHGNTTEKVLVK